MILAIVVILIFLISIFLITVSKILSLRNFGIIALLICLFASGWICFALPKMHKPFSIDIIEYLIKINNDGSMTTTKQVTKTLIKNESNEDVNK